MGSTLVQGLEEWRELALKHRDLRLSIAHDELRRIKTKYDMRDYDFQVLRDFFSGSHLPSFSSEQVESDLSASELVENAKYRLRLVEAGTTRPRADENASSQVTKATIALWIRDTNERVEVELYGHPCIYASAETEEDAVTGVLTLMDGFHTDFCGDEASLLSNELRNMRDYLLHVFG